MTARSPGAFFLSATFHAAIVAVIVLFAMFTAQPERSSTKVLELVAGAGDNYAATVAPALGSPEGVKLNLPRMPVVTPAPEPAPEPPAPTPPVAVQPVEPAPTPVTRAPSPPRTATVVTKKAAPTFKREFQQKVWAAQWRARQQIKRERAAEERRRREEELERLKHEKALAAARARRAGSVHVASIDAKGIAAGVLGGSTANSKGGAGGHALTASGPVLDAYYAMLMERIRNAIDKPPGISDQLAVTIAFHISPEGRLWGARVAQSSGNAAWDQAVLAAFSVVTMPEQPEHKDDYLELIFKTKDQD